MATKNMTRPKDPAPPKKPNRCADCDSDCWDVHNKLQCWLGWTDTDHCPWVHNDVPFPPRAS